MKLIWQSSGLLHHAVYSDDVVDHAASIFRVTELYSGRCWSVWEKEGSQLCRNSTSTVASPSCGKGRGDRSCTESLGIESLKWDNQGPHQVNSMWEITLQITYYRGCLYQWLISTYPYSLCSEVGQLNSIPKCLTQVFRSEFSWVLKTDLWKLDLQLWSELKLDQDISKLWALVMMKPQVLQQGISWTIEYQLYCVYLYGTQNFFFK